MTENERIFISAMDETHPALKELPPQIRTLWFKGYQHQDTKNILFLQMERIFKNEQKKEVLDVLTLEIADMDALLEWEDEFPDKEFVAIEPYTVFFDGLDDKGRAMLSIGEIDTRGMEFVPELEIYIQPHQEGILVDFQDGTPPELWKKYK